MTQSLTVRQSASDTGIHRNSSFRWRHRFLEWISQDRPFILHGINEVAETNLLEFEKGGRNLNRKAGKRGGSATKRGVSNEQVCVLVARDHSGQTLDFVTGNGPLTKTRLSAVLKQVLDSDPLFVSNANPSYTAFVMTKASVMKSST